MAWQKVARLDALGDGGVIGVDVDGKPVALYRIGDSVYATDGMCTHATGLLADGFLEDGEIECPLHQARFDIRTGKALCEPATEDLRTYPVKVEGADVLIDLERAGTAPEQASPTPAEPLATAENGSGTSARRSDNRESVANEARETSASGNGVLFDRQYVWPGRPHAHSGLGLHGRGHLRARDRAHLPRAAPGTTSALEAELPNPGDFIRSNVGPTPVVVARAEDGSINVFENRCAHRAAEFCRELTGNDEGVRLPLSPMDLRSERQSHRRAVPARRRRQRRHARGLQPAGARAAQAQRHHPSRRGVRVLCATTWSRSPTISVPRCCASSRRPSTAASCKVLGHYRHSLPGNWKLYHENLKDPYHATLLHTFLVTFGLLVAGNRSLMLTDEQRPARRDGVGQVRDEQGCGRRRQEGDARLQGRHDAARAALHGLRRRSSTAHGR